ncbi:Arm DNA-binding domain-containing protein [Oceanospirillum sp.]|uniref:Arm DNA-binding domain-containing protein n=1 Tax=Oceanospirillum sp. TaxID=2021254 RepID=UPI003A930D74
MGNIYSRGQKLYLDFRYKGVRCREATSLTDTPANKKRLKTVLQRLEAEITLGVFDYSTFFPKSKKAKQFEHQNRGLSNPSGIPLFKDFAQTWLSEKDVEWRKSYVNTVVLNVNTYLIPVFGKKVISDITKSDILQFRSTLAKEPKRIRKPLKPATINKIMTPLRMILNEAADRYEFTSPWKGIKSLKVPRTDVEPFTLEEVKQILQKVRPDFQNYYAVRFFTGMRTGEIDGLKWEYVDFDRKIIQIRETFVKGEMTYTKTDGSQRDILMSQPVLDALKRQHEVSGHCTWVFCNQSGQPLNHKNISNRVWYPILDHLGLKRRRPYQTRHTAATLWLAAGENPEWIARQMGHTTTEMLFRVYSRYVPNLTRRDGSAFNQWLQASETSLGETHIDTAQSE